MTLSDLKGKQIIKDTLQKCFLQGFQTMTILQNAKIKNSVLNIPTAIKYVS
jgi:hypothetical protein